MKTLDELNRWWDDDRADRRNEAVEKMAQLLADAADLGFSRKELLEEVRIRAHQILLERALDREQSEDWERER